LSPVIGAEETGLRLVDEFLHLCDGFGAGEILPVLFWLLLVD